MIKVIIFDIGGVLIGDVFPPIMKLLSEKSGNDKRAVYKMRYKHWRALKLGEITEARFWKGFTHDLGVGLGVEMLCGMARESMHVMEETVRLVRALKNAGYRLAILSNNAVEWGAYGLDAYDLRKYFDEIVLSCNVHMMKPDKDIYELTLSRLGEDPRACVFIDNQEENLNEPEKMGIHTIHFKNSEQLKKELKLLEISL